MWEKNAKYCERTYGAYVDWEERFYICPDCGDTIYECDWTADELTAEICPICGFSRDATFTPVFDDEELDELFG